MALVVICGQPCSGKSKATLCLSEALKDIESKPNVRIIDETYFHLDRNQTYADMTSEKNLRGVLRSEVDRYLSKDNIIIVHSLNSINGYRYDMSCGVWLVLQELGIVFFTVMLKKLIVETRITNETKKSGISYDDHIFEDLARRFEKPDSRNRWDSPLYELLPFKDGIEKSSHAMIDLVSYVTKKADSKTNDVKILQPTIATQSARFSKANSLYEMDRATQEVTSAIVVAQSLAMGGPVTGLSLSP